MTTTDSLTPRQEIIHLLIGTELTRDEILHSLEVEKTGTEEKAPYVKALGNLRSRGDVIRNEELVNGLKMERFCLTEQGLSKAWQDGLICPSCRGQADVDNVGNKCLRCVSPELSMIEGEESPTEQTDVQQSDFVEAIAETKTAADERNALLEVVDRGMDLRHIPNAAYHARILRKISEWPALDHGVANWMASLADLLEGRVIEENV